MKYIFILGLLSWMTLLPLSGNAQVCEGYFSIADQSELEYSHYDKKEKMSGRSIHKVSETKSTADGIEATVATEFYDDKGELVQSGSFGMRCTDDKIYIDMSNMVPAEMTASLQDMEMEMSGDYMEFPNHPVAGQSLPDGNLTMIAKMDGTPVMNMTVHVTDRKIEGFETITTPAGTFECMKYSESSETKMIFKIQSKSITWYAKNIGMVKTESYDDKGKLQGYTLLTGYKK
jgi:hypothetical protein